MSFLFVGFRSCCGLLPLICGFAALVGAGGEACGNVREWTPGEVPERPCLCAFDIDRTLTGFQDLLSQCPDNEVQAGVRDYAYLWSTPAGYGNLTLSRLSQALNRTFCSRCYLGLASAGGASLDGEKAVLLDMLRAASQTAASKLPTQWFSSDWPGQSQGPPPLVIWCRDGHKHDCTRKIVAWYREQNVTIADADVWFFDDKESNTAPFRETSFNAQQISCGTRDGTRGLCGATPEEVQFRAGVFVCRDGQQVCMDKTGLEDLADHVNAHYSSQAAEARNYRALFAVGLLGLTSFK